MADYTNSKGTVGAQFPPGGLETTFQRLEPLITPTQVRSRHLWGVALVSGMKDPRTGKADVITDLILADCIDRSVALAELETHTFIFPLQVEERLAWDVFLYRSHGYLKLSKRPVASIESLSIAASDMIPLYHLPLTWIDLGQIASGQINIIPLTIALNPSQGVGTFPTSNPAGAMFLGLLGGGQHWIPSWWLARYSVGYPDGMVPKVINDLVGTICAMEILGLIGPTLGRATSSSLGIDGMSQSVSGPGAEVFKFRLEALAEKRAMLVKKIRVLWGSLIFSGEV